MRARRLRVEELKLGPITIECRHPELGELGGTVEDISMHGLSVVLPVSREPRALLVGVRVDDVRISCETGRLYDGPAVIRRISHRDQAVVLGLELEAGLNLGQLHRSSTRSDFTRRWESVRESAAYSSVRPAFKAWVAELRSVLVSTHEFLTAEERTLAPEDQYTRRQAERDYVDVISHDLLEQLETAARVLERLVGDFSDAEHREHRAYCKLHLAPLLSHSPFLRRARDKPFGYAGDYEMMNMLYRDPAEGETLFGRALNVCFTHEPAAQANKNRLPYIGGLIRQTLAEHPRGRIRIASLACGPAREIGTLLEESPELGARLDVALIDHEARAIAHCERTLAPLAAATGARIQFICEGFRTLLAQGRLTEKLGERELVYSAGLFDYLDVRMFRRITSVLYDALTPGGLLAIGNVADHNPSRWVMEYFSEWFLFHRSKEALLDLASEVEPRPQRMWIDCEPSGINLFLLLRR
jgi:extracellular factor (EF) 3-hydroxypalmitic acid methyl ester biosynthesis protein